MSLRRRQTEAAARFEERRRREQAAPRLHDRAPELATLKLEVEELNESGAVLSKHVRHIVVERAPALFVLPCGDTSCEGGGYEITETIMRGLISHQERFEAEDRCLGGVGNGSCTRRLHVTGIATYTPQKA